MTEEPSSNTPSLRQAWRANIKEINVWLRNRIIGRDIKPNFDHEVVTLKEIPPRFREKIKKTLKETKRESTVVFNKRHDRLIETAIAIIFGLVFFMFVLVSTVMSVESGGL